MSNYTARDIATEDAGVDLSPAPYESRNPYGRGHSSNPGGGNGQEVAEPVDRLQTIREAVEKVQGRINEGA